jgi:hypothetical protein
MMAVRSGAVLALAVGALALSGCGQEPEAPPPGVAADGDTLFLSPGGESDFAAGRQQLRYQLQYERRGESVRPAGRDNAERASFTFTLQVSQGALMEPMPAEGNSRWTAWHNVGSETRLEGQASFTARVTRDRYDSDFPTPLQVSLEGQLGAEGLGTFSGLFPGGLRNPDPAVHLELDIPFAGTISGGGYESNPGAALMTLAAMGSPVAAAHESGAIGRAAGELVFRSGAIARPADANQAMLYDMEGMVIGMFSVGHPSLNGTFEGGQFSGDPRGVWRYDFTTERSWNEGQDSVSDRWILEVFPVSQTVPHP